MESDDASAGSQPPLRTCFIFSLAFHLSMTSFNGLQNVESSINDSDNLGIISITVVYVSGCLCAPFYPSLMRILGAKPLLYMTFMTMTLWTAAYFYPRLSLLVPVSALMGAWQGSTLMTIGVYMSVVSNRYIKIHNLPPERLYDKLSFFNGLFYFFYQSTQISGNLISSAVLFHSHSEVNRSAEAVGEVTCGASLCASSQGSRVPLVNHPDQTTRYILIGAFLTCNLLGTLLVCFLPELPNSATQPVVTSSVCAEMKACTAMFVDSTMLMLLPMFVGHSMLIMFLYLGFTKAFITCSIGVQWVGLIMLAFGVVNSGLSILGNSLGTLIPRQALVGTFLVIDVEILVTLLLWDPVRNPSKVMLTLITAMIGVSQGIAQPQFNALLTTVFEDNLSAAFVVCNTSKIFGYVIALAILSFACLYHCLVVSLVLTLVAVVGYCVLEVRLHHEGKYRESRLKDYKQIEGENCSND